MKLFLDSANLNNIKSALDTGLISGITTNPSLLAKEKVTPEEVLVAVDNQVPVSLEVTKMDFDGMVEEASQLDRLGSNVVVKFPLTVDGLKATRALNATGVVTNVTLVFTENQALLAARSGATYVSLFLGRLEDYERDVEGKKYTYYFRSQGLLQNTVSMFKNYGYQTKVIAASIRSPEHVTMAATMGSHVATVPYDIFTKLYKHPLTDSGLQKFLDDYKQWKK